MNKPTNNDNKYEVKLGHLEVTVDANTPKEALLRARSVLRDQLPRLWDVITSLADDRFDVAPVHPQ